jgi:hypothetical protein
MPLTPIFQFFWPYKASEGGSNREGGSIGGFTVYIEIVTRIGSLLGDLFQTSIRRVDLSVIFRYNLQQ